MIVTRKKIIAMGVCGEGLIEFDKVFPSGEAEYEVLLLEASKLDNPQSYEPTWHQDFIRTIGNKLFGLRTGKEIASMNEKYQVFDPLIGSYTQYNTLEEAKAARQVAIDAYVQRNIGLFSVSQEVITDEGNSLWNPLTEEQLAQ